MSRCTAEEVTRLLPLVSAQRREQALRYKHVFGQYCCLRSWMMLKELMNGVNDDWEYNEYGKPSFRLSPLTSHLHFSISHSKAGIAVVVDSQPVGIDIETIRHATDELIDQTMNEEEKSRVKSQKSKEDRDREFTRLWTQKEAVLKAIGTGIQSFEQLKNILEESGEWKVESRVKDNYVYSIAFRK